MSDGQPQSALREWRRQMSHPLTLVAMGGIGLVMGIAGPFGTEARLSLLPRLAYWLAMVVLTYGAGVLVSEVLARPLARLPKVVHVGIQGMASGLAIAAIVLCLNLAVFGWWPSTTEMLPFLATLMTIALIVTAALHLAAQYAGPKPQNGKETPQETGQEKGTAPAPQPPALLDRLPLEKRGPLVALSVEDHYTRVRTTRGEDLLLLRLSDAIRETDPVAGAKVHRSHWIAFDQVESARRAGDRALLTMSDGCEIPVSRANVPLIREAGLLPR